MHTIQTTTEITPVPHISGWRTYEHEVRMGSGEPRKNVFFAPDDEAALTYADKCNREDAAETGVSVVTLALRRACRP